MPSISMTSETTTTKEASDIGFVLEDYTQRVIIGAVLAVVFGVGVTGNTLVIMAVNLSRRLQSPTNWFVVNLAATDLITCIFTPFHMVALLSKQGWPLPDWICAVSGGITFMCVTSSTTNLALIAFNRWYLLTKPRALLLTMFSRKKMIALVVSAWLYSMLVAVVPTLAGVGAPGYSYKFKTCTFYDGDGYISTTLYGVVLGFGMLILPAIPTVTFYILIYRFVKRHTRKMASRVQVTPSRSDGSTSNVGLPSGGHLSTVKSDVCYTSSVQNDTTTTSEQERACTGRFPKSLNRRHVTFTKKMALIVCVFFACYLPSIAITTMPLETIISALPWAQLLVVVNSSLNPIIYAWAIPTFREVMECILRCRYKNIPEPVHFIWRFRSP